MIPIVATVASMIGMLVLLLRTRRVLRLIDKQNDVLKEYIEGKIVKIEEDDAHGR